MCYPTLIFLKKIKHTVRANIYKQLNHQLKIKFPKAKLRSFSLTTYLCKKRT